MKIRARRIRWIVLRFRILFALAGLLAVAVVCAQALEGRHVETALGELALSVGL